MAPLSNEEIVRILANHRRNTSVSGEIFVLSLIVIFLLLLALGKTVYRFSNVREDVACELIGVETIPTGKTKERQVYCLNPNTREEQVYVPKMIGGHLDFDLPMNMPPFSTLQRELW